MNQEFDFVIEVYQEIPRMGGNVERRCGPPVALTSSGSKETRARRRILDELHKRGVFARSIKCIASRPAKKEA
jgi:hypothetical protein